MGPPITRRPSQRGGNARATAGVRTCSRSHVCGLGAHLRGHQPQQVGHDARHGSGLLASAAEAGEVAQALQRLRDDRRCLAGRQERLQQLDQPALLPRTEAHLHSRQEAGTPRAVCAVVCLLRLHSISMAHHTCARHCNPNPAGSAVPAPCRRSTEVSLGHNPKRVWVSACSRADFRY